jgi:hypothetical protein
MVGGCVDNIDLSTIFLIMLAAAFIVAAVVLYQRSARHLTFGGRGTLIAMRRNLSREYFILQINGRTVSIPRPSRIMSGVRRRLVFLFRSLLAKAASRSINRLLPIIEKSFDNPWVARVELKIHFRAGHETKLHRFWRLLNSLPRSDFMHWDAPVTVSVFRKRRGKEQQALCMSFYIRSGILYIVQLQGVRGTDIPKELRPWPKIFIDACRKFACEQGLREVKVAKASTQVPYGGLALTEEQQKAVPRIRRDMELLYDRNALDLGLVPDGKWFRWQNAKSIRDYQPTILRRAIPAAASVALTATTTAILFQTHDSQAAPQGLVYFYLIPLVLIAIFSTARMAILSAGMALLCADYFLQNPIYSFYTSEYDDLILFAILAGLGIKAMQKLIPRSSGDRALTI